MWESVDSKQKLKATFEKLFDGTSPVDNIHFRKAGSGPKLRDCLSMLYEKAEVSTGLPPDVWMEVDDFYLERLVQLPQLHGVNPAEWKLDPKDDHLFQALLEAV